MSDQSPLTQRDASNLNQSLRDLTNELRQFRGEIASTYVRKDVLDPQLIVIKATLATHGSWFTWIVRTVGAVLIVGLIGLLLSGGIHYGGTS